MKRVGVALVALALAVWSPSSAEAAASYFQGRDSANIICTGCIPGAFPYFNGTSFAPSPLSVSGGNVFSTGTLTVNGLLVVPATNVAATTTLVSTNATAAILGYRQDGTIASPTALVNNDNILLGEGLGWNGSAFIDGGELRLIANGTWAAGVANSTFWQFANVETGGTTGSVEMRVGGAGGVAIGSAVNPAGNGTLTLGSTLTLADATTWTNTGINAGGPNNIQFTNIAGTFNVLQLAGTVAGPTDVGLVATAGALYLDSDAAAGQIVFRANGAVNKGDYNATTAATWTWPTATTFSNATIKLSALASSSASQTGTVCSGAGGLLTVDTTTTCLLSSQRFKRDIEPLSPSDALAEVMRYRPVAFRYKDAWASPGPHFGELAEDMAEVDQRLVVNDKEGRPLQIKYIDQIAILISAFQGLQEETTKLRRN